MASDEERARRSMGTPKWPLNRQAYNGPDPWDAPAVDGLEVVERLRALADTPAGTGYADAVMNVYAELPVRQFFSDLLALSTQVQRLTEENEALRKGKVFCAKLATGVCDLPDRLEAAEARIKALEEALRETKAALLAAEERDNHARFRANSPREDAEVTHLRTSAIRRARTALKENAL